MGIEGGCKLRVSWGQRDRTGENQRKGTKQAVGCDRKINTYNVQNSQALFGLWGNCGDVTVVILAIINIFIWRTPCWFNAHVPSL